MDRSGGAVGAEPHALGRAPRGGIPRRHRAVPAGQGAARLRLRARAVANPLPPGDRRAAATSRDDTWRLCLRRFRYFWLFDETNPKTRVLIYRVSHLGLLVARRAGASPGPVRRAAKALAHSGHGVPDRRIPHPDDRLGAVSHPHRAAHGGLGRRGTVAVEVGNLVQSAAPGNHVVGIGLVCRLERGEPDPSVTRLA